MAYTTESAVREIVETDSAISMAPFIEGANALVEEVCATAVDEDGTPVYDTTRLELIERWLAGHFYRIRDAFAVAEKAGPVAETKAMKTELGFNLTREGQMALRFDTNGGLAALENTTKTKKRTGVGINWLGTSR